MTTADHDWDQLSGSKEEKERTRIKSMNNIGAAFHFAEKKVKKTLRIFQVYVWKP